MAPPITMLDHYEWSGNIRELESAIEGAMVVGRESKLNEEDFAPRLPVHATSPRTLGDIERAHILATFKETKWVLSWPNGAAKRLGMNRSTLQFRMKKLGILRPAM